MIALETTYRFDQFKSKKDEVRRRPLRKLTFAVERRNELAPAEEALQQGSAIAEGMALAKNLATCRATSAPGPSRRNGAKIAKEHNLDCQVLERADMESLGMGSLLRRAKARTKAPKLIVLQHKGARPATNRSCLVGKGITFDTGGISLKPGPEMDEMKFDMCGAAACSARSRPRALMKLPLNLTVVVPAAENMPGGGASKPGDIVTSMSGQTIEILNTDAEGRLILCDALTYAERFEPDVVVDVATLTGACVIALGHVASGLFANDDDGLAAELLDAATKPTTAPGTCRCGTITRSS